MNNTPDALSLARFPNLAILPNLFFNLHTDCATYVATWIINCKIYYPITVDVYLIT